MEVHKGIVVAMACMGLLAGSARTVRAQAVAGSFAELQGKTSRLSIALRFNTRLRPLP